MAGASLGNRKTIQVKKDYFTLAFLTHEKLRKAIISVFPYLFFNIICIKILERDTLYSI